MESYYDPKDLGKFQEISEEAPDLGAKFFDYYQAVFKEGELTEREKALIALAVAHTIQCPYCIDIHSGNARQAGATDAEIVEAAMVAASLRAGAAVTHATHALVN